MNLMYIFIELNTFNEFKRILIFILSKLFSNLLSIYENIILKYIKCDS